MLYCSNVDHPLEKNSVCYVFRVVEMGQAWNIEINNSESSYLPVINDDDCRERARTPLPLYISLLLSLTRAFSLFWAVAKEYVSWFLFGVMLKGWGMSQRNWNGGRCTLVHVITCYPAFSNLGLVVTLSIFELTFPALQAVKSNRQDLNMRNWSSLRKNKF